ncbi:MAG: hypothetical protein Q9227_003135 [Pyrenula ochraceoflavens]
MQIDPAALSRPSEPISTPLASTKSLSASVPGPSKTAKAVPFRIDEEPVYTELKSALGSLNWSSYHDALTRFTRGTMHHPFKIDWKLTITLTGVFSVNEFSEIADSVISTSHLEHLHNNLICAIAFNCAREAPEGGVASWVSANDKPQTSLGSKPALSGDAAEQRLKTEVMQLPPRDRRRLKAAGVNVDGVDGSDGGMGLRAQLESYHGAMQMRVPDAAEVNKGGLTKTNWDMEIRRRYTAPLSAEVGEFPSVSTIYARMVPICYEESVTGGASQAAAELVAIAAEARIKDLLVSIFHRTRSNAPGNVGVSVGGATASASATNGIYTNGYRRQLEVEEHAFREGEVTRGRENGLLPVEAKEAGNRRILSAGDLKLTRAAGRGLKGFASQYLDEWIIDGWEDGEREELKNDMFEQQNNRRNPATNGFVRPHAPGMMNGDEMDIDGPSEDDWGWEGARDADRQELGSLLDDLLAARS